MYMYNICSWNFSCKDSWEITFVQKTKRQKDQWDLKSNFQIGPTKKYFAANNASS